MEARMLSSADAARYVGLSARQLRRLRSAGRFPEPVKLSGDIRSKCLFDRRDLDAWIDRQKGERHE